MTLKDSPVYIPAGDHFVNARVERIVQAIKDYEPELDVEWTPPAARVIQEDEGETTREIPAFKIVHKPLGGHPMTLFFVKSEEEFDERVLMRIIQNDQRRGQVKLSDYEAWEAAQKRVRDVEEQDRNEEMFDLIQHVLRTNKSKYVISSELVIKDNIPMNALRFKE